MKIKIKITALLGAALGLFAACSDYDVAPDYSVGEDNAIVLGAGIGEGGAGVQTRAVDGNHAGNASGGAHTTLKEGTKMTLRVDGTWLGKADNYALPHGKVTSQVASQTTTATVGSAFKGQNTDENNTHNEVSMNPQLYWDDYGTADPANMSPNTGNGRDKGLTIYGAAVDDATVTDAPTVSDWTALQWSLPADQTGGWTAKDLITSNNIRPTTGGGDGTFKFDDFTGKSGNTASNLLEFTHAMSKITVELTAGEGFDGYATNPATAKFKNAPTVTLLGFNYIGKVDIVNKNSTATQADYSATDASNPAATANIKTWRDKGVAWTTGGQHTSTFDAIVFPGNKFTATIGAAPEYKPTSTDQLLELNADGNIYKVTAGELVKAIKGTGTTGSVDATIEQGYNYLIKITVNKTKIEKIEATIVDWKTYETEGQIIPKINVTASYGEAMTSTNTFTHDFEFFRSLSKDQKYSKDATVTHTENAGVHSYTLSTPLYWPDHATHYFFRGVYPLIGTESGQIPEDKVTASEDEKQKEYISVENVRYAADTYPSDLAIGYPRTSSTSCSAHSKDVDTYGICATEGTITMNFEYAMSQVEVKLSTTENTDDSHVIIDANTAIKIVGGYDKANILLKDGSASFTGISKADWTMPLVGTDYANRHDAIVPQTLGDMKFSVTVKNSNDTYDTYECKIADIQVKEKLSDGTYGALTPITKWESGKKYVYELKLKKTAITAVATITPWNEVKAEENIWF